MNNVINIRVMNVIIPYSPYNVYKGSDSFKINIIIATVNIPDGYYTISQLLDNINTDTNISSRGLKFKLNPITYKIEIINASYASASYTLTPNSNNNNNNNINNDTLLERLGLIDKTSSK